MITDVAHGYVGIHSPYDLAHKLEMIERAEANKHIIGGIYCPNAWSQARKQIEVNGHSGGVIINDEDGGDGLEHRCEDVQPAGLEEDAHLTVGSGM